MAKACIGGVHRRSARSMQYTSCRWRTRASAQRLNDKGRLTSNFLGPIFSVDYSVD
jgi:hypothetical protein